jgi:hypothetical protein
MIPPDEISQGGKNMRVPPMKLMCPGLFAIAVLAGACSPEPGQDTLMRQRTPAEVSQTMVSDFQVEVFCSEVQLRTGLAAISWETAEGEFINERLDVTIFKDGFEKGIFTSVSPSRREKRFTPPEGVKLPDRPDMTSLLLATRQFQQDEETGRSQVLVERLEPGVIYFWRISTQTGNGWVTSAEEQVLAPVCPADLESDGG